jgi:DNA adenine methylase
MDRIYRSPLFYVGDKYKLLKEIKTHFPSEINKFIEPFTGGGSVFLNTEAKSFHLNDIDKAVVSIHNLLNKESKNPKLFFNKIAKIIDKYELSKSFETDIVPIELKIQFKKTFYAQFNKKGFQKLKYDYNSSAKPNPLELYILLIYGFNRMLRFNSKGEYNLPVGNVDFNKNVVSALNDYFNIIQNRNIFWKNIDYIKFIKSFEFEANDFVYFDPPYLITFSEYNKLWNEENERELINLMDELNTLNVRFAISNVTHYKGKVNTLFNDWSKKYNIHNIKSNYISYHDNSIKSFNEVLVTNYG